MNVEKLRERLTELDKEYNEIQEKIAGYTEEINKLNIRKNQLNGAYQEISKLIQDMSKEN